MCRWLAYAGRPIYLDELLFKPENSLISQSLRARCSSVATNGDGFGVGWYGQRESPGLYRDFRPAWNDENLQSLAEQIQAGLFFAHVRASTGTATSRANCHPFRHGRWLFMHNGAIGGFDAIARALDFQIEPGLYRQRGGTTDSETFFYLLLSNGLERDPHDALRRTVARVEAAMAAARIDEPLRLTAAVTDGTRIFALRYSSDRDSPSLYYDCTGRACLVLSEPLDEAPGRWSAVAEGHLLTIADGRLDVAPFDAPRSLAA